MARQARSERTRDTIIKAAADMFERYGYGSTSLSDVISHAGVTKGSLYFHFSSKEELAHAVVHEQHAMWMGQAQTFAERPMPALEGLVRMSYGLAEQLIEHPVVRAGIRLTLENGTFQRPRSDPYLDWIGAVEDLLRRAAVERELRLSVDPTRAARFIVSAFTGIQLVAQVLEERKTLLDRVEEMWDLLLPGLVVPKKLGYYLGFAASVRKELRVT
jgi:AcrR family transcriptional regulator